MQVTRTTSNVVMLPASADTCITPLMIGQATHLTAVLLQDWFACSLDADVDRVTKRRRDYLLIKRVAGPPVDSFRINCLRRGFSVDVMNESSGYGAGRCQTLTQAFQMIRDEIDGQLAEWRREHRAGALQASEVA